MYTWLGFYKSVSIHVCRIITISFKLTSFCRHNFFTLNCLKVTRPFSFSMMLIVKLVIEYLFEPVCPKTLLALFLLSSDYTIVSCASLNCISWLRLFTLLGKALVLLWSYTIEQLLLIAIILDHILVVFEISRLKIFLKSLNRILRKSYCSWRWSCQYCMCV